MTTNAKTIDYNVIPHTMNRIDISTGVEFDEFIAAFEKVAPSFDPASVAAIVQRDGDWDEVLAAADAAQIVPTPLYAFYDLTTKPRSSRTCTTPSDSGSRP